MYVCLFVRTYVCTHVCVCVCYAQFRDNSYVMLRIICMYVCMYVRIYVCVCVCVCDTPNLETTLMLCFSLSVCIYVSMYLCMDVNVYASSIYSWVLKLIAFELAAKFSRRRENPVQPRVCNAKNAIFKRSKRGVPFGRDLRRPTQTQSALCMYVETTYMISSLFCVYICIISMHAWKYTGRYVCILMYVCMHACTYHDVRCTVLFF
jgi:hypothetical protein